MNRVLLNADDEFAALISSVRRSSWRWECQGEYAVDLPEVRRWRAGEPAPETAEDRAWLVHIRALKQAGIPFQRVRMLTEPLTEYLEWMLQAIGPNVAAGEEVRWIQESEARTLGLPDYDYYLLDDERVAFLLFTEGKVLTGVEVEDDPDAVAAHQAWRALAWSAATPHEEYVKP